VPKDKAATAALTQLVVNTAVLMRFIRSTPSLATEEKTRVLSQGTAVLKHIQPMVLEPPSLSAPFSQKQLRNFLERAGISSALP